MHRRCMACIFDFGLKGIGRVWINDCIEASPKVIYPALKEYSMSLRPENIKSHLQVRLCVCDIMHIDIP